MTSKAPGGLVRGTARRGFVTLGCFAVSIVVAGCSSSEVKTPAASLAPAPGLSSADVSALSLTTPRLGPRIQRSVKARRGVRKVGRPYVINGRTYRPHRNNSYDEVGTASWYGPQFHGKPTANGEIFDMNVLSAAHRTLPLPSLVRVTNLANNRSIVVRVNDRGPYAHNRIIDLSRRSAQALGFIRSGTAKVRVTYVGEARLDPKHGTNGDVASADVKRVPAGSARRQSPSSRWSTSVRRTSALVRGSSTRSGLTKAPAQRYGVLAGSFRNAGYAK